MPLRTEATDDAGGGASPAPGEGARGAAAVWDKEHRALTTGLVLTVAFSAFEALAVATVLPVTVREIGGLDLYGWAFSGFMLANLLGIVAAGRMADHRGLAAPFTAGTVLFVLGLAIAGVAATMPIVVAGRVVQGLGAGAIAAVSYAAIAVAYPDEAKPRMLALLSSAWVIPGLLGPALAGAIADTVGWRVVFLGLAPPTVAGAALALVPLRRLPHPQPSGDGNRRVWSAFALTLGAAAVLLGLEGGSVLAPLAVAGGTAIAVPALWRLLPAGTLRFAPGQPAAVALMGMLGLTFFGAEVFVPLALSDVRGQAAIFAGLPLTLGTLSWTAGAWIQAHEAPRRSRAALVAAGVALMWLGIAGTASVLSPRVPAFVAILTWGVAALGMGIAYSSCALAILEGAAAGHEGGSSAALQLSMTLGTALGTGLGGAILAELSEAGRSVSFAILAVDAAVLVALGLALIATPRLPGAPTAST